MTRCRRILAGNADLQAESAARSSPMMPMMPMMDPKRCAALV